MVSCQKFKVQQMDIKGAYLNGTLKERVYMQQPEGYNNDSRQICLLIKTLYGLKQSGCEWNIELDTKLQKHGYKQLKSDLCTYMHYKGKELAIITVWVDDLLMFATSDYTMETMKNDI
jgi:Reverse transcriptase (RNA-dependent DNA polymerase)